MTNQTDPNPCVTTPTTQEIAEAVLSYHKTLIATTKLAEEIGVPLNRLKVVLAELEKKGGAINRGAFVEVT